MRFKKKKNNSYKSVRGRQLKEKNEYGKFYEEKAQVTNKLGKKCSISQQANEC